MADIKIASMVEATSITDTDLIVVEDSADTKKITKANFKETTGINAKAPQATTYTKTEVDGLTTSGSNANGEWTKFSDGTLICTIYQEANTNTTSGYGALFRSSGINWAFPMAFFEKPEVFFSSHSTTGCVASYIDSLGPSSVNYKIISVASYPTVLAKTSIMAKGRWKAY